MLFLYGSLKLEKVVKICIQQRKPDSGTVNVQLSEEKTHQSDTKMSHKLKVSNKTRMTFQATGRIVCLSNLSTFYAQSPKQDLLLAPIIRKSESGSEVILFHILSEFHMSGGKTRTNWLRPEKENHWERRMVSIYYPFIVQFYLHDSFPFISRLSVEKA